MPLTLSVILCTRNRPDDLGRCLRSLAAQTQLPSEILVIDASDAPPAGLGSHIESELTPASRARITVIPSPAGLPLQRNTGLRLAHGDVVAFFDDDVELEPGYVEALMAAYQRRWFEDVGGICGSTPGWKQSSEGAGWLKRLFGLTHVLAMGDRVRVLPSLGVVWIAQCLHEIECAALPGHCMSFRRTALLEANVCFDETLGGYADGEDVDVSLRIGRSFPLYQIPDARLTHHRSRAQRAQLRRRFMTRTRNERYLHRKLMPRTLRYRLAFWWSVAGRFLVAATVGLKHRTLDPVLGVADGLVARI